LYHGSQECLVSKKLNCLIWSLDKFWGSGDTPLAYQGCDTLATTKTKVMAVSKNNVQTNIISDNVRINQVHTHRYLGCVINDKMDCKVEIKARIEMARSAFIKYKTLLCSCQINQHLRL
jgi:hypothetical protein